MNYLLVPIYHVNYALVIVMQTVINMVVSSSFVHDDDEVLLVFEIKYSRK